MTVLSHINVIRILVNSESSILIMGLFSKEIVVFALVHVPASEKHLDYYQLGVNLLTTFGDLSYLLSASILALLFHLVATALSTLRVSCEKPCIIPLFNVSNCTSR